MKVELVMEMVVRQLVGLVVGEATAGAGAIDLMH